MNKAKGAELQDGLYEAYEDVRDDTSETSW